MQHLEGSGTPVLYIGRRVLKGKFATPLVFVGILMDQTSLDGNHTHILCTLPFKLDIVHEILVYVKLISTQLRRMWEVNV
jgi:hypothetical protein